MSIAGKSPLSSWFFEDKDGETYICSLCPAGTSQPSGAALQCEPCLFGEFQASWNAVKCCERCPSPKYGSAGGYRWKMDTVKSWSTKLTISFLVLYTFNWNCTFKQMLPQLHRLSGSQLMYVPIQSNIIVKNPS